MTNQNTKRHSSRFDLNEIANSFPEQAQTLLLDRYLVDRDTASARVFRVYRGTPPHYHVHSDEHLYVLSGRGTFWIEGPVVFLAVDAPRRDPKDIVFVNPENGTPESFIHQAE